MLTALEQVLQSQYATTLTNEFPKFTWHNYFMNNGTYDAVLPQRVYTNLNDPLGPGNFHDNWQEWQLFRFWLKDERRNWQAGNAGVRTAQENNYANRVGGPPPNYSSVVESQGVSYVEFLRPATIGANTTLSVTLDVYLPFVNVSDDIRVSVLPIRSFSTLPHPSNQFIPSTYISIGRVTYRHTFRVANFHQCDRAAVIINNLRRSDAFEYTYTAELIPPLSGLDIPCALVWP